MAPKLQQQLEELGSKLESPPASKDALVELLKQGVTCLSELDQTPPKSMLESMQPFLNAIAKPELLKHQDEEVKLFVAACICEITRITAPDAPYDDDILKDIFQLIVSTFSGLSDTNDPSFGRRVVILETLARYRSCVVMLDLECDDLINEMFNTFVAVASPVTKSSFLGFNVSIYLCVTFLLHKVLLRRDERDEHPENVLTSMQTIMEVVLEESEDVQENLLRTLLSVLGRDKEDVTEAARKLAMNVTEHCAGKLEPGIKQYLVSSMSGDNRALKSEINYHGVLYNIYHCALKSYQELFLILPESYCLRVAAGTHFRVALKFLHLLHSFILLHDQVADMKVSDELDIRLKAVGLVGDLFALPGSTISGTFQPVFSEFLKRLTDRVPEVIKPDDANEFPAALCDRLLDYDENVRKQVVAVICDVACHTPCPYRLKLSSWSRSDFEINLYTMERLADIYRVSCMNRSGGSIENDAYDWIVGKVMRCFYDKDLRSDIIEPILSLSLFPSDFSVKDKVKNWVRIFSGFDKVEVKALEKILEQKQRLQQEMQKYLSLRQLSEDDGAETQKKVMFCFRAMSRCFTDPAEAEENFQDELLKILEHKHRLNGFLSSLSLKCSYLLFDKDHVKEILLEAGVQKSSGNNELILSCMTILVILARFCPLLLGGIEEDLVNLLEDDNEIIKEGTLHILAKAGELSESNWVFHQDLILERICFEGNRRQAKYAVHALASITKDDGLMSLSVLYKRLVDMLEEKAHLPAVLQSLGCIAQAAMPVFETRESEIEKFIKESILEHGHISGDKAPDCWDDRSELCSLKIFGVKALVKSYLPVKDAHLRSGIDGLIEILKNILSFGDISREIESSLVDKAHLKLAAAKSVLRLSRHWEHKIPIDVFYLTLRTSEDRILDPKYACAFLLDISSQQSDLEENKRNLSDIIQMCRQGRGRHYSSQTDASSPALYPEYMLPYVVHSLAHHPSFPNIDECKDAKAYEAMYRRGRDDDLHDENTVVGRMQLYLFLSMLVYGDADGKIDVNITKDKDTVSLLNSIFLHIKRSEDAFDAAKSKVGEEKTWLADDVILAHFESLELEANGIVDSVLAEDDIMKDSETEGSEIPLGKLMKRLKAKGAKARKEVKNESAPAGVANENNFDILKMVKEINSDNLGTAGKSGSSNGPEFVQKKKRSNNLQKRKTMFSKSTDLPVPKRKRTASAQAHKSLPGSPSKGKRSIDINQVDVGFDKMDEELQTSSEDQSMKEKIAESAESDLLVSCIGKKSSSSSKQKGKRSNKDHMESLKISPNAKKPKRVAETGSPRSVSSSKSVSMKKQKQITGLAKERVATSVISCYSCASSYQLAYTFYGVPGRFQAILEIHDIMLYLSDTTQILYDDGDVEVLRLEKERWELVDNGQKSERASSSKALRPKGGSSGKRRKSTGGPEQDKNWKSPSSQVRKKRTPRKSSKQKQKQKDPLKSKSTKESSGSPDVAHPESTTKSDSEKEQSERIDKSASDDELSDKNKKQEEDVEKGSPEAEEHKEEQSDSEKEHKEEQCDSEKEHKEEQSDSEKEHKEEQSESEKEQKEEQSDSEKEHKEEQSDSENTESDDIGDASHDSHKSHNKEVSSSDKMDGTEEVSGQEADEAEDMDNQPTTSEKPDKKTSVSDSADVEISDDELLVLNFIHIHLDNLMQNVLH
ncbi:hypothetical protein DH2020_041711 [Rehmannia glutinosa]|uniref:Uncharacterized protein n=1 Tax=Rehmannia glutinosa TaxID=99300 RepID=A0ABR0URA8_REHGL